MSWVEEYARDLTEMQRGNYGQCPYCERKMNRYDIAAQIDAPTEFDAEACLACKCEAAIEGRPEEVIAVEPHKPSEY